MLEVGKSREDLMRGQNNNGLRQRDDYFFGFYAGQPQDVRKLYEEAMGI